MAGERLVRETSSACVAQEILRVQEAHASARAIAEQGSGVVKETPSAGEIDHDPIAGSNIVAPSQVRALAARQTQLEVLVDDELVHDDRAETRKPSHRRETRATTFREGPARHERVGAIDAAACVHLGWDRAEYIRNVEEDAEPVQRRVARTKRYAHGFARDRIEQTWFGAPTQPRVPSGADATNAARRNTDGRAYAAHAQTCSFDLDVLVVGDGLDFVVQHIATDPAPMGWTTEGSVGVSAVVASQAAGAHLRSRMTLSRHDADPARIVVTCFEHDGFAREGVDDARSADRRERGCVLCRGPRGEREDRQEEETEPNVHIG